MSEVSELVFVGTAGTVVALDALTGVEVWRAKLPGSAGIVTMLVRPEAIYAGVTGRVFALDPLNGEVIWKNELTGLGYGTVLLAMSGWEQGAAEAGAAEAKRLADKSDS